MATDEAILLLGVRQGNESAWEQLIALYQGRLLAFATSRLQDPVAAEDLVQEAFLGFLVSLPNYDETTPLETFLFAITAHKLTDALRRAGRRPLLSLIPNGESAAGNEPAGPARKASSLARSGEQRVAQQQVLSQCLRGLIQAWLSRGEFERLECVELLFVLGYSNREAALKLRLSEQAVANHKDFVIRKLKGAAAAAKMQDPDLHEWRLD